MKEYFGITLLLCLAVSISAAQQSRQDIQDRSRIEEHGFISVKDFGAKGDGLADDTAAFDAALKVAMPHADTIFFPSGRYRFLSRPAAIGSGVKLVGAGSVGSNSLYGSYLIADYSETDDQAGFLT